MADNTFVNIGGHKVSAGIKYSTTEVKTGDVWIDGKPIYRRVVTGTSTTYQDGNNSREFTLPYTYNISSYVNAYGSVKPNNGSLSGITFGYPQTIATSAMNLIVLHPNTRVSSNTLITNVITYVPHACTSLDYTITIEYTKTTD